MITKHDIGETILIKGTILHIEITKEGTTHYAVCVNKHIYDAFDYDEMVPQLEVFDRDIADGDFVTTETYESEINELKSIIEEKDKEIARLKAPSIEILRKDFSHHPSENIYAKSLKNYDSEKEHDKEDWRLP